MKAMTGDMNLSSRLNKSNSLGLSGNLQPFLSDNFGTIPFIMYFLRVLQMYSMLLTDL